MRTKKYTTTVTLIKNKSWKKGDWQMFYCGDCKNPIMKYQGEIVKIVPGDQEILLPIEVQCSNRRCNRLYRFEYFVE